MSRPQTDYRPPSTLLDAIKAVAQVLVYPVVFCVGIGVGFKIAERQLAPRLATLQTMAARAVLADAVLDRTRNGGQIECHHGHGDNEFYSSPIGTPFSPHERETFVSRALNGECFAPGQTN